MTPVYLDCNATNPIDPQVRQVLIKFLAEEYGNEGSRTHEFGVRAKTAVSKARTDLARLVAAKPDEVIFTSGATESNNIAILGLMRAAPASKRHIVTTAIEHKAVLEPIGALEREGCAVTRIRVGRSGVVDPDELLSAIRSETHLVSVMAANNETGMRQPIQSIGAGLPPEVFFHVDAAQAFGRDITVLQDQRIDLISVSGHKIYGPKGVGALIMRRRGLLRPPIQPLIYGGGQERAIRPGTLPVPLVAAMGAAVVEAESKWEERHRSCVAFRERILDALQPLNPTFTGDERQSQPHVVNLCFEGIDSEALMVATKDLISISNGSACTSTSYKPSHVLLAMGMTEAEATSCVRISWCHMTQDVDWTAVASRIRRLT